MLLPLGYIAAQLDSPIPFLASGLLNAVYCPFNLNNPAILAKQQQEQELFNSFLFRLYSLLFRSLVSHCEQSQQPSTEHLIC